MVQPQSLRFFLSSLGQLYKRETLPLTQYKKIEGSVQPVDATDLTTDEEYLWEIGQAISNGQWPSNLT